MVAGRALFLRSWMACHSFEDKIRSFSFDFSGPGASALGVPFLRPCWTVAIYKTIDYHTQMETVNCSVTLTIESQISGTTITHGCYAVAPLSNFLRRVRYIVNESIYSARRAFAFTNKNCLPKLPNQLELICFLKPWLRLITKKFSFDSIFNI